MVVEHRKQSPGKVFTDSELGWDNGRKKNAPANETSQVLVNMGEIT